MTARAYGTMTSEVGNTVCKLHTSYPVIDSSSSHRTLSATPQPFGLRSIQLSRQALHLLLLQLMTPLSLLQSPLFKQCLKSCLKLTLKSATKLLSLVPQRPMAYTTTIGVASESIIHQLGIYYAPI
jgi:hypothetical protein